MNQINYGIIHAHTENSLKDSVLSPMTLCKKAADYGAPAVVLTDHGVLTGVYEFMHAAKECGIKGIPGVEAYMQEDSSLLRREHLLLIPKDYQGYCAISHAVTESNTRIFGDYPCMNLDILCKYFGENTKGHDHVIATSACVGGILSQILLQNKILMREADKVKTKLAKYVSPDDPAYKANIQKRDELDQEIKEAIEKRDAIKKIAEQKFKRKEQAVNALEKGSSAYIAAKIKLDAEKNEAEQAITKLAEIKKEIAKLTRLRKEIHEQCKQAESSHPKWLQLKSKLDKITDGFTNDDELYAKAKNTAKKYVEIFGTGNFYIELQYHRISDESYVMPLLANIAGEMHLPIVACNDVHFASNNKDDVRGRQIISSLRFNKFNPLREGDTEYYIKTDSELKEILLEILPEAIVDKAINGIADIVNVCNVEFPHEKHYPKFPDVCEGETAKDRMCRLAREGIASRYPGKQWDEIHENRLEYELSIIEDLGFSDYLNIVEDFLTYGRKLGVDNPEEVGLSVGPGRGSAVGSLVCYLMGITGIDPLKHGLIFERFLNRERVSMPDIDSDFDTNVRDKVLDYVKQKYGEKSVCNILTKGTCAARASIRDVARILGDERYGDKSALLDLGDKISKEIPKTPKIKLSDVEDDLMEKFKENEDAIQIIKDAKLIEGAAKQYGVHAGGVIIADNHDVSEYVPLMWNTTDKLWVCQCDMVEAETDAGLLKMDFLGLRNLNIISEALRRIKHNYGISIDMVKIGQRLADGLSTPFDRSGNVFTDIFSKGMTNSVFQFQSAGMKTMLKQFGPSNLEDIILLVAAYRPGPMQYLNDIIEVKHGKKNPEYIIPEMESVLGSTYGYPIYQEQIQQIFHKFAGFTLGEADIIRRYMSKKKADKFASYKEKFIEGIIEHGANPKSAEEFWEQLLNFSAYAFNKSHACAYAYVATYTAWLKLNYPTEYMTAVLNHSESDDYPMLINDCKEMGIKVLPPNVNESDFGFKDCNGDILFGLSCVKGIKNAAQSIIDARKEGKFCSFRDFLERSHIDKSVIERLIMSSALDVWCKNRNAMLEIFPKMLDAYKKIGELNDKITNREEKIRTALSLSEQTPLSNELLQDGIRNKKIKKIDVTNLFSARENLKEKTTAYARMTIPIYVPEDKSYILAMEKELIGTYVSGHPLDDYKDLPKLRSQPICDAVPGQLSLCGLIKDVRKTRRKKDGAEMAFFTLEDETGTIEVCCFVRAYEEYRDLIQDGNVVMIKGRCIEEESIYDNSESVLKLNVEKVKLLPKTRKSVLISVNNIMQWADSVYNQILLYSGIDFDVFVHDKATGEIRKTTDLTVSQAILSADIQDVDISLFPE